MLLLEEERKIEAASSACVLRILPNCVFNARDPIVLGVHVVQGMALIGAPLCVPEREYVHIGWISSIQDNHTDVPYAGKGQNVAIMMEPNDDIEYIEESSMYDVNSVMSRFGKSDEGVYVQAPTLRSLEAMLEYLKTPEVNIAVSGTSIGPIQAEDVTKASHMAEKKKEYATILAYGVRPTPEASQLASQLGVEILTANNITHQLFHQFSSHVRPLEEESKREAAEAVFPCVLKIIPNCVFNTRDPIAIGVHVVEGIAKIGTPICVPGREFVEIGTAAHILVNILS
ncbi:photosystem II [Salvia divinorum]|uniref:Photosystem II n=1 Tax=Salvia divinorum TaxID=28513 RepID=A0ABD1I1Z2_SALDI